MDPIIQAGWLAPAFELPDLDDRQYHLAQARLSLVILNFWSAECPWSERFDREIQLDLARWGKNVRLWNIAANEGEGLDLLRRVAAQRGLEVVLRDSGAQVADLYGAQTTPHVFLIDAAGILRYQGAADDRTFRQRIATRFYLREAVEAVLNKKLPDPHTTPAYGCTITRRHK